DDVQWPRARREADRAQHRFRIVDADGGCHRHGEKACAFLSVDHCNDARLTLLLEATEQRGAAAIYATAAKQLHEYNLEQRQPERRAREVRDVQRPGPAVRGFHSAVRLTPTLVLLAVAALAGGACAQAPATHQHQFGDAARWTPIFDDPRRDAWQKPHEVIEALALKPDAAVADIGAGTGYFTVRLARMLPKG